MFEFDSMGKKSIEVHGLNQLNAALRERTFSIYDGLRRKFYLTVLSDGDFRISHRRCPELNFIEAEEIQYELIARIVAQTV